MGILKYMSIILILINIFLYTGCNNNNEEKDKNIVAEYGDGNVITFAELNQYVNDWSYVRRLRDNSEAYKKAINDMLKNQLKRVDFFEKHLDTNSVLMQNIGRTINEEIIVKYFEKKYLNKYVNEEFAKEVHKVMDKMVVYQEIILKKPEKATKNQISEIEKKASAIKIEADNGTDFTKLVQLYSQDTQSAKKNGYASPASWKQSILDPVGNIIFNLKENDIRLLSTNSDYRIIKVDKINKIHIEPFEKIKNELLDDISKTYSQKSMEEFIEDQNATIDTNSIKWNDNALKKLVRWSGIPNFYGGIYEDTLSKAIAKEGNKIILTYKNGKVDYKEYLRLLNNILTMNVEKELQEEDIKKFLIEAVTTDKMLNKAYSMDIRNEVFNAYSKNPVIKNKILQLYNQEEIENKIPPLTEENFHKFFKENEEAIFYQLKKVNLFAMVFKNQEDAEKVYDKIESGVEFEKVTGRYFVKTYIKERNGEFREFNKKEKPVFAEKAFKMKLNEISEPVKFIDGDGQTKYAVLKCKNIRPEKQLTYDEAKKTIDKEFEDFYRGKLEKEIEKELAEKYHPEIYYDVISNMIAPKNAE